MRIPPLALDPDTGLLDRDVLAPHWFVPALLKFDSATLHYAPFEQGRGDPVGNTKHLLLEFVNLADASDADISGYARRFGVLGLCEQHNCPVGHPMRLDGVAVFPGGPSPNCHPAGWPGVCQEPIDQWRVWSKAFGTLLRLATALRMGEPGELEDWFRAAPALKQDHQFAQRHQRGFWGGLLKPLNAILDLAPRRLGWGIDAGARLVEDSLRPEMMPVLRLVPFHDYAALWVALSAELAFAASGAKSWFTCSECGRIYPANRTPTRGKLRFCPEKCGRRAAWRAASRRYYESQARKAR
jgi:hypothetical protein